MFKCNWNLFNYVAGGLVGGQSFALLTPPKGKQIFWYLMTKSISGNVKGIFFLLEIEDFGRSLVWGSEKLWPNFYGFTMDTKKVLRR